jgi:hypothetical protein
MTDVSRRRVIGGGAAAVTVGVLGLGGTVVGAPGVAHAADPTYTSADSLYRRPRFSSLRGKYFGLSAGGTRLTVRLVEVADLPGETAGSATNFRLRFTCGTAGPRSQGTYTLRRSGFTTTSLFLVPEDGSRRAYTAIVNSAR